MTSRKPNQSGQALTEFLVLALALVPFFLLLPMIGKYQDVSHATQAASRYVAFEATLRNDDLAGTRFKTAPELAGEVQRRFFSRIDAPIKTGDVAGDFEADRNPLWADHAGNPLIDSFGSDVCVNFGLPANGFCSGSTDPRDGYGRRSHGGSPFTALASQMNLRDRGIYTGTVQVRLANIAQLPPFDALDLTISRHTSVVPLPWTAPSVASVDGKVKGLVPISLIKPVAKPVEYAVEILELAPYTKFEGPGLDKTVAYARDLVPPDRLCNYGAPNCPAAR